MSLGGRGAGPAVGGDRTNRVRCYAHTSPKGLISMVDSTDILLQHWDEQRAQSRQCEDQRATMTNIILLVASAALGFIAQRGLDRLMLLVTVPLVVVGLFGAVASAKFYERFRLHNRQARRITDQLVEHLPDLAVDNAYTQARTQHNMRYRFLTKIRLHHLWISLHLAIAITGVALTVAIMLLR